MRAPKPAAWAWRLSTRRSRRGGRKMTDGSAALRGRSSSPVCNGATAVALIGGSPGADGVDSADYHTSPGGTPLSGRPSPKRERGTRLVPRSRFGLGRAPSERTGSATAGDDLDPLGPGVSRLVAEPPGRLVVVHLAAHRLAGGEDDGEAHLGGGLHGAGEEAARVAGAEVDVLAP